MKHIIFSLCAALSCSLAADAVPSKSVCNDERLRSSPANPSLLRANMATARSTCPRSEVQLDAQFQSTVHLFEYGLGVADQVTAGLPIYTIGSLRVGGAWEVLPGLELSAVTEAPQVRFGISGYRALYLGFGDTSLAASLLLYDDERFAISAFGRGTLPTALGLYQNNWPVALESGVAAVAAPTKNVLRFHGTLSGGFEAGLPYGIGVIQPNVFASVGTELRAFDRVSLSMDGQGLILFGKDPLNHFSLASKISVRLFAGLSWHVQGIVPILGANRNLLGARTSLSYGF